MASLITHPVVPVVAALVVGRAVVSVPLLILGISFSMLPDLDIIGFRLRIPYGSPFGHRGFSHSIVAALLLSMAAVPFARALKARVDRARKPRCCIAGALALEREPATLRSPRHAGRAA